MPRSAAAGVLDPSRGAARARSQPARLGPPGPGRRHPRRAGHRRQLRERRQPGRPRRARPRRRPRRPHVRRSCGSAPAWAWASSSTASSTAVPAAPPARSATCRWRGRPRRCAASAAAACSRSRTGACGRDARRPLRRPAPARSPQAVFAAAAPRRRRRRGASSPRGRAHRAGDRRRRARARPRARDPGRRHRRQPPTCSAPVDAPSSARSHPSARASPSPSWATTPCCTEPSATALQAAQEQLFSRKPLVTREIAVI